MCTNKNISFCGPKKCPMFHPSSQRNMLKPRSPRDSAGEQGISVCSGKKMEKNKLHLKSPMIVIKRTKAPSKKQEI